MGLRVFDDPTFPVAPSVDRSAACRKAKYVLCAIGREGSWRQVRVEVVKRRGASDEVRLDRSEGKSANVVVCLCRHKRPVQ